MSKEPDYSLGSTKQIAARLASWEKHIGKRGWVADVAATVVPKLKRELEARMPKRPPTAPR